MPVMNGLQATNEIRNESAGFRNKNIPIIALTANYTEIDRENCSKVGMNDFLSKPFDPIKVEKAIHTYIDWNNI